MYNTYCAHAGQEQSKKYFLCNSATLSVRFILPTCGPVNVMIIIIKHSDTMYAYSVQTDHNSC